MSKPFSECDVGERWFDQEGEVWTIVGEDPDNTGEPFVRFPVLVQMNDFEEMEYFDEDGECDSTSTVLVSVVSAS